MKKIGILTYFSCINNGAFLQAYSFENVLKNRYMGHAEILVINYTAQSCIENYSFEKKSDKGLEKIKKYKECWNTLNLSKGELVTDDINTVREYIKKLKLDCIITGSDEVFKTNGYRGFPNPYWLNYDIGTKIKMSYAASGRNDYSKMDLGSQAYLREALKGFSYIGVRDAVTMHEIHKFIDSDIYMNCDPTVLYRKTLSYDTSNKNNLKKKWKTDKSHKLIVLMISDRDLSNKLYRMFRSEYIVYDVLEDGILTDLDVYAISPFEWSELIAASDLVITSFFHGTMFSLIHNTIFFSLEFEEKGRGKIENLLHEYGLNDYLFYASDYDNSVLAMTIYTKWRKMQIKKEIRKYTDILIEEEKKSKSFFDYMDKIIYEEKNK